MCWLPDSAGGELDLTRATPYLASWPGNLQLRKRSVDITPVQAESPLATSEHILNHCLGGGQCHCQWWPTGQV